METNKKEFVKCENCKKIIAKITATVMESSAEDCYNIGNVPVDRKRIKSVFVNYQLHMSQTKSLHTQDGDGPGCNQYSCWFCQLGLQI
jgi:hypothetical protein